MAEILEPFMSGLDSFNIDVSSPLVSVVMLMILVAIGTRCNVKSTIVISLLIISVNHIAGNTGFTPYLIGLLVLIIVGKMIDNNDILWRLKNNGRNMKNPSFLTKIFLSFGLLKVKQKTN